MRQFRKKKIYGLADARGLSGFKITARQLKAEIRKFYKPLASLFIPSLSMRFLS
jgi:hypothetical protein